MGHGIFSVTGKFHFKNSKSQVQNKLVHHVVQWQSRRETPEWKHITSIQQNFCCAYPRKLNSTDYPGHMYLRVLDKGSVMKGK